MWECGLKHEPSKGCFGTPLSLLMWECGLKQLNIHGIRIHTPVTPYVGVWIETKFSINGKSKN